MRCTERFLPQAFCIGRGGDLFIASMCNGIVELFSWDPPYERLIPITTTTVRTIDLRYLHGIQYEPENDTLLLCCTKGTPKKVWPLLKGNTHEPSERPRNILAVASFSVSLTDEAEIIVTDGRKIVMLDGRDGSLLHILLNVKSGKLGGIWDVKWSPEQPKLILHHGFGYGNISTYNVGWNRK